MLRVAVGTDPLQERGHILIKQWFVMFMSRDNNDNHKDHDDHNDTGD